MRETDLWKLYQCLLAKKILDADMKIYGRSSWFCWCCFVTLFISAFKFSIVILPRRIQSQTLDLLPSRYAAMILTRIYTFWYYYYSGLVHLYPVYYNSDNATSCILFKLVLSITDRHKISPRLLKELEHAVRTWSSSPLAWVLENCASNKKMETKEKKKNPYYSPRDVVDVSSWAYFPSSYGTSRAFFMFTIVLPPPPFFVWGCVVAFCCQCVLGLFDLVVSMLHSKIP